MDEVKEELALLAKDLLGESPVFAGESFNLHYASPSAFVKVTRAWVKPERFRTEVAAASSLAEQGFPVAKPIFKQVFTLVDGAGKTRHVTFWERLTPTGQQATSRDAAEWAVRLWAQPVPLAIDSCFQLADFEHAVHVRLDGSSHPYARRIIEEVETFSSHPAYLYPTCGNFIHGDLHPDNLLHTPDGVKIIDWESSCRGPLEWDAAQTLRYTDPVEVPAMIRWWEAEGVDLTRVFFYRRVRSMTSLSHMIAAGVRGPAYHRTLAFLGWPEV